jgi:hypothetical protein
MENGIMHIILWPAVNMAVRFIDGVPEEKHWLATIDWQTLSHNVVSSTPRLSGIRTHNVIGDCIGSCKSNYYVNRSLYCVYEK